MKEKVYISGAIAHYDPDERRAAFSAAAARLRDNGFDPVNPFDNGLPQPGDWREHMRVDIDHLLKCDYIYMLKGWWLSKGAKLELDVATSCGLEPIFEEESHLNEAHVCCICGRKFYGFGRNPRPLKEKGVCCDFCNERVVKERLRLIKEGL